MENKKEMPAQKFAGILLILIPVIVWGAMYLRFDCAGGHCSMSYEWVILGTVVIVFGLIFLLNVKEDDSKIAELEGIINQQKNKINELSKGKKKKKR